MDEKRIVDTFSSETQKDSTDEGPEQSEPLFVTKLFREACPRFMAMGMSYDEYWNGSAERTRAYREAWELKKRQVNQQMWMQGIYFIHALNASVGNMLSSKSTKIKYPEEPFPLSQKERREQEEREEKRKFEAMKQNMIAYAEKHNARMKEVRENERSNNRQDSD